ncbi:MAG: hypothetical protein WA555_20495 [Candidatus Sulfotelmatobacter sp.]
MKTTIFAFCFLCLFCATAAFGQSAPVLTGTPQPLQMQEHIQHASQHAMAQESSLLDSSDYTYAQGEQPLSDFVTLKREIPLGDVARALRKKRADAPKAVEVWEN